MFYLEQRHKALDYIKDNTQDTFPFLLTKFDIKKARKKHTLRNIFVASSDIAVPYLLDKFNDQNSKPNELFMCIWLFGEIADSTAELDLYNFLQADTTSYLKSKAVWALGKMNSSLLASKLDDFLYDDNKSLRREASFVLSKLSFNEVPALNYLDLLHDDYYPVRYNVESFIKSNAHEFYDIYYMSLNSTDSKLLNEAFDRLNSTVSDSIKFYSNNSVLDIKSENSFFKNKAD